MGKHQRFSTELDPQIAVILHKASSTTPTTNPTCQLQWQTVCCYRKKLGPDSTHELRPTTKLGREKSIRSFGLSLAWRFKATSHDRVTFQKYARPPETETRTVNHPLHDCDTGTHLAQALSKQCYGTHARRDSPQCVPSQVPTYSPRLLLPTVDLSNPRRENNTRST